MSHRKPSLWLMISIALVILGRLALPGATARSAGAQSPLEPPAPAVTLAGFQLIADDYQGTPTSITRDAEGYTIWTYDNWNDLDYWCVQFSRLRWPFDLGAQDPTELSETTLIFTFAQKVYVYDENGPLYTDPTWAVALNGKPGLWVDGAFTGEWNIIGAIGTEPTWNDTVFVEQEVPFDHTLLIDGENNIHFQQQDFGYCSGLPDCACTCYDLASIKLRARVKLGVKDVSPAPDARNVSVQQSTPPTVTYSLLAGTTTDSEIRVRFTTVVSENTVNEHTFQVYYLNDKEEPVYISGAPRRLSDVEYVFVPDAPLRDGIRYRASVWGETDEQPHHPGEWVQDVSGGPMETGRHWTFWTLPQLEVRLEPVQVLEDEALIVGKPTALRVFLSSANFYPDVYYKDLWEYVDVQDIQLTWRSPSGSHANTVSWRADETNWHFAYAPETARRTRLNDKFVRLASQDSVNYYGFTPEETGYYWLRAKVTVVDSRGEEQPFVDLVTPDVVQTGWLTLHSRALAVGSDYGKTGTVNLSTVALGNRSGVQALYPVPNARLAQPASAIPYYQMMSGQYGPAGLFIDWAAQPAGTLYLMEALLQMNTLCLVTSGCDMMTGYAPMAWVGDIGLTQPEVTRYSMLVQSDGYADHFRFIVAHEGGHLYSFEHDTRQGGQGYDVRARADRRISTALMEPRDGKTLSTINSFMNQDPVESPPPERLWIEWINYRALRDRLTVTSQAFQQTALADPRLLATGLITPATGAVQLAPWYQLEPGDFDAPTSGPYRLVFLDGAGQEIVGYTRAFSVTTTLQPAGPDAWDIPPDTPAPFALKVPYPAATARIQIRRNSPDELLAERTLNAIPPTVTITPPVSVTWSGPQPIAWESDPGETRYYLVQLSTDNGATWEAQAVHWPSTVFTLETTSILNTTQALVRVLATDGLNTASAVAGPFTIANPVGVDYVSPAPDTANVNVDQPLYAGFRAAMDPTTIHSATFTLSGGPYGTVRGLIRYDEDSREATFIPQTRLAYSTTYTAHVSAAIQTLDGAPLSTGATWSFTTEPDFTPPRARLLSPAHGALDAPRNTVVAVAWDRPLDAGTLTTATFNMVEMRGAPVTGSVAYEDATHTATFTPDALLAPYTTYVVTLTAGISDTLGNATFDPTVWAFTTGNTTPTLALTGSYADWGHDADGDGLYEQLIIRVGVGVTATGSYALHGALVAADGSEIVSAYVTPTLTAGAHFLDLAFDGAAIGGGGEDGPYALTDLTLTHLSATTRPRALASIAKRVAYRTFAYPAGRFPAPLHFGGLPDVLLLPGMPFLDAFNVREYAQHTTLSSDQLSYTVMLNSDPNMSVTLQTTGIVRVVPEAYWEGRTHVTIRASDGVHTVQDTFTAAVGWPHTVYLPVVLRSYGIAVQRDAWITYLHDDFESDSLGWVGYASTIGFSGSYQWGLRDCRAYSGQQSAWAYGDGSDGELLSCGADYPNGLWTWMYKYMPVDLKYVAKGEYSAKVWTDLAPGAQVCLSVARIESGYCQGSYGWPAVTDYHGVCRSGQTNGWENLTLDLANVPGLGNVLGERVCINVEFYGGAAGSGTRPEGAYVDDVTMRLCPEGLTEYCDGTMGSAPPTSPPLVAGNIGGYPGEIGSVALGVESTGRAHALWTGKLNAALNTYVFYSSAPDGVNWMPYQILSYWGGREPQIAVDNVHGRVHLAYGNDDGVVHHTVVNSVVSDPVVAAPHQRYNVPEVPSLQSGTVAWPSLAVAEQTGVAYLVWRESYYARVSDIQFGYVYSLRYKTWHATWNKDGGWSAPLRKINDEDTQNSTIIAAPDGQTMLAWFQQWAQLAGGGTTPGDPIVARTAYGTEPGSLPLRQATHDLYPVPQRDESIVMAYAGGDDSFVLASHHLMWPGHSRVYRYVWKDDVWSEPLTVAGEFGLGWNVPVYVGAAANVPVILYVYNVESTPYLRAETNGVLGAGQPLADYLSARGYTMTGFPLAYFTDAAGGLHMVISGENNGVAGFYYVSP